MRTFHPSQIRLALMMLVIVPLLVGIAWRRAVCACDYIAQVALLLLMLLPPWCTPAKFGAGRHFGLVFLAGFTWGIWRGFYFDIVTRNDIPGMGYLVLPFMMVAVSFIALIFWGWLCGGAVKKSP